MLKKMMLLAMAVAAIAAFAVPASASAATDWTHNDVLVPAGSNFSQSFEGKLSFTVAPPIVPVHSTYGCQVTIEINVTGPTAATVKKFNPTTSTCEGTGVFAGCKLKADKNNIPAAGWAIENLVTDLAVKHPTAGTDLTIFNEYEGCAVPSSDLEFKEVTVTPTLNAGKTITSLAISGTSTTGAVASGSLGLDVPSVPTLGLQ